MSNDVFYTNYTLPPNAVILDLAELMDFLNDCCAVVAHRFDFAEQTVSIVVANKVSQLKYSECPLPGTHDFAAGWIVHDTMLRISKHLGQPIVWKEAEYYNNNGLVMTRDRGDKPEITVGWATF